MKNDRMKMSLPAFLETFASAVEEPKDLFKGRCLPCGFSLPDNVLVFFHDFTAPIPNAHGRHTLVLPLDEMIYYVERKEIRLRAGMMLYIPPYAVRFLHPGSAGYRRLFITFDVRGPQEYLPETGAYELERSGELLQEFLHQYRSGSMDRVAVALMDFLKDQKSARSHAFGEAELPEILVQVISRIESHLAEVYSVKMLSDAVQVSESRLRAVFRQHIGVSIGRFITEKRMDCARYWLLNSDSPIAEIARRSGFANVYVFSAFFKRNAGISPLHFRQKNQSTERG